MVSRKKNNTRQTIDRDPLNPEPHLDSGYEGDAPSTEFSIPPCGIEDSDVAVFNLFDKDIGFTDRSVSSANKQIAIKKPFVIFATGERFALTKKLKPPRDKNSNLMLPAITVRRTGFTQTTEDITGRGINQFTGVLKIKKKLANTEDVDYQNLINRMAFKNLDSNSATSIDSSSTGELEKDVDIYHGGLLTPKTSNNMYEIITIPQPQYFTNTYEVVFWTNYTQHMNYLIETYVSSFLPQIRGHKLNTDKGYWFMCYAEDSFTSQENFDDFSEASRVIRYSFNINVKGFILAPNHETNMVPVRKWISSPIIKFESLPSGDIIPKEHYDRIEKTSKEDRFTLSDLQADPKTKQTPTSNQRLLSRKRVIDPKTGKPVLRTVAVLEANQKKGETVYYASSDEAMGEFIKSLK
jgi:hypothetical protein